MAQSDSGLYVCVPVCAYDVTLIQTHLHLIKIFVSVTVSHTTLNIILWAVQWFIPPCVIFTPANPHHPFTSPPAPSPWQPQVRSPSLWVSFCSVGSFMWVIFIPHVCDIMWHLPPAFRETQALAWQLPPGGAPSLSLGSPAADPGSFWSWWEGPKAPDVGAQQREMVTVTLAQSWSRPRARIGGL